MLGLEPKLIILAPAPANNSGSDRLHNPAEYTYLEPLLDKVYFAEKFFGFLFKIPHLQS